MIRSRLLRALQERGIEYIVVGGFAVNAHGFIRVTKDLDIVPSPAAANLERLAEMLRDLDATILDTADFEPQEVPADPTRAEDLTMGGNFCMHTDLGRLYVMQWLSGLDFEDLYGELDRGAIEGSVDGLSVRVCGLDHLRAMKRAAGRPRDLEDLKGREGTWRGLNGVTRGRRLAPSCDPARDLAGAPSLRRSLLLLLLLLLPD